MTGAVSATLRSAPKRCRFVAWLQPPRAKLVCRSRAHGRANLRWPAVLRQRSSERTICTCSRTSGWFGMGDPLG
jgi:hypothetical protein